jgi:sugar phosphate isomerase/epimerase
MNPFAVSSWSLDGMLNAGLPLLALPGAVREHGLDLLELCHFHLPTTDDPYLRSVRRALDEAGVRLLTLLIDTGDIAAPDPGEREAEIQAIRRWLDIAAALGAERARIVAGRQPPTPEVIERSAAGLAALGAEATARGVRPITENWLATGQEPDALLAIISRCGLGLCVDVGNAEATADKYATIERLMPHAASVHFKARYGPDGALELDDLRRSAALMRASGFDGPISLIYQEKRDEWAGIARLRAALEEAL